MLKYLTHKLRTQSINENIQYQQQLVNRHLGYYKIDGHDSGTESDGDVNQRDELRDHDMEISSSTSRQTSTSSPTGTVGSASAANSPVFLNAADLAYDPHSSEEELEVINGTPANLSVESEVFDDSPKRSCSSTVIVENRKRSLAQSSEDELRNFGDHCTTPVNFCTSPPLEALKPHRNGVNHTHHHHLYHSHHHLLHHHHSHHNPSTSSSPSTSLQRSATPLILTDSGRGFESIRISCDSPTTAAASAAAADIRSISPPAKFFHCAVSPRRRPNRHPSQRLLHPRPHRPCLDFDKMQQVRDVAF